MRIDPTGRVIDFVEKPKSEEALARVRTDPHWMESHGIQARGRSYLASMGIYLFSREALVELLQDDTATDFGKEVFPSTIQSRRVQIHPFDGYWEDIGTVAAFHRANLDLCRPDPPFDFTAQGQHIFTRPRYMPCSRIDGASVKSSLIADGATIGEGCVIENSVVGIRSQIGSGCTIRNTYIMGADLYEGPLRRERNLGLKRPDIGIGGGSVIENAIVDKNARIGRNVRILNSSRVVDGDVEPYCMIRDGVVVIPKFAALPDGLAI
jgi:glucose-1-phosphate adenylyltransferase